MFTLTESERRLWENRRGPDRSMMKCCVFSELEKGGWDVNRSWLWKAPGFSSSLRRTCDQHAFLTTLICWSPFICFINMPGSTLFFEQSTSNICSFICAADSSKNVFLMPAKYNDIMKLETTCQRESLVSCRDLIRRQHQCSYRSTSTKQMCRKFTLE